MAALYYSYGGVHGARCESWAVRSKTADTDYRRSCRLLHVHGKVPRTNEAMPLPSCLGTMTSRLRAPWTEGHKANMRRGPDMSLAGRSTTPSSRRCRLPALACDG